jgi:hypothetical protein
MKKLLRALALLSLGFTLSAFSALPRNIPNCQVCAPSYCGNVTLGLTGLYWRATTTDLDYALLFPGFTPTGGLFLDDGSLRSIDQDFHWGYQASIGYLTRDAGSDIYLTYSHFEYRQRALLGNNGFSLILPTTTGIFDTGLPLIIGLAQPVLVTGSVLGGGEVILPLLPGTAFTSILNAGDIQTVSATSLFKNDTWDLDFGQTMHIGSSFSLRYFGGLRYSYIRHEFNVTHNLPIAGTLPALPFLVDFLAFVPEEIPAQGLLVPFIDVTETVTDATQQRSIFQGVGPRLGIEANYHLGGGLGLVGKLSAALLVGRIESKFTERLQGTLDSVSLAAGSEIVAGVTAAGLPLPSVILTPTTLPGVAVFPMPILSFKNPEYSRVVPNIDAKLGLDWCFECCNCSRLKVTIEAGYYISHYFKAIDRLTGAEIITPELSGNHTINASFDGPYAGVQVVM